MKPCYERYLDNGTLSPDLASEHEEELRAAMYDNIHGVPMSLLGEDVRRLDHFWTGEDWPGNWNEDSNLPRYFHRNKEELLSLIAQYSPNFYKKLVNKGLEKIQGINLTSFIQDDDIHVNFYAEIHYPKPILYIIPYNHG